jgi:hypothetical protein
MVIVFVFVSIVVIFKLFKFKFCIHAEWMPRIYYFTLVLLPRAKLWILLNEFSYKF